MSGIERRGLLRALPASAVLLAASGARAGSDAPDDKPFAEHHLALQLSDKEAGKQALVLSVAFNLLTFYGPDKVAIEVIAFGPGIDLLVADSANRQRVDSLVAQGVRFDVCMNTVETVERETGKPVSLNPHAHPVRAGAAQLLLLAEHGYTVVRP